MVTIEQQELQNRLVASFFAVKYSHYPGSLTMSRTLKTLQMVQWLMLSSILAYAVVGELVGPGGRVVNPTLNYVFSTLGVAIVGFIFVVRRTLVFRAAESLASQPDDGISLNHFRTGYIATYALCEALGLFGFTLRFLGCNFAQCAPFYIGAFVLLFFFRPKLPAATTT